MPVTHALPKDNRFVTWTDWDGYLKFLEATGDRRVQMTYDRGTLEIVSLSQEHERLKKLIAGLIECLAEELGIDLEAGGSMTFRRRDLDRGLEPDECYWRAASGKVLEVEEDPEPPRSPDLVVEVDISRRSVDRVAIYQAMGVPEIWLYDRRRGLRIQLLGPEGYRTSESSRTFPGVELGVIRRHVEMQGTLSLTAIVRSFRKGLHRLGISP